MNAHDYTRPRIGDRPARRLWLLALVGGALAVLLASCGSSSNTSSTTPATSGASTSTSAAVASTSTSASTTTSATTTPEDDDSEYATPAATPAASPSAGSAELTVRNDPKLGAFLTGAKGLTLYIYKNDMANTSTCYDKCASNWPPLIASSVPSLPSGATGTLSLITRKDGTQQVAYNGMPLYYFFKDTTPGDANGQDIGDVWYVASVGS